MRCFGRVIGVILEIVLPRKAEQSYLEDSVCRYGVCWRLMLVIFLGMAIWQGLLCIRRGSMHLRNQKYLRLQSTELKAEQGNVQDPTGNIIFLSFLFVSSQSSACLQPGEWEQ